MARDPSSTVPEVDRSPSPQTEREAQSLLVLRAIVEAVEGAVQQTDPEGKSLTRKSRHATEYDEIVELISSIIRHLYCHDPEAFVTATKALADGSRNGELMP